MEIYAIRITNFHVKVVTALCCLLGIIFEALFLGFALAKKLTITINGVPLDPVKLAAAVRFIKITSPISIATFVIAFVVNASRKRVVFLVFWLLLGVMTITRLVLGIKHYFPLPNPSAVIFVNLFLVHPDHNNDY